LGTLRSGWTARALRSTRLGNLQAAVERKAWAATPGPVLFADGRSPRTALISDNR
jgi:hypothetical protein